MKIIAFTHEVSYRPREQSPYVDVRFPDARVPVSLRLLLDSGAGMTVLNRRWANHLNIPKITSSKETVDFTLADKRVIKGYVHPVRVEFLGRSLTIDAAFVPTSETESFIGMRGFFDKMQVGFDHAARKIHVAFA